jgi:hypothetical protein
MGRCRFVQPETVKLPLSDGDWVEVKKRLNVGEERKAMAQVVKEIRTSEGDSRVTPDLEMMGKAELLQYITDWSFRDMDDKPVPFSKGALDSLDPDSYKEIEKAVDAHKAAMEAERNEAKKPMDGERKLSAISPSAA